MSTATFERVKKFLDQRSVMRGIDQNEVAELYAGNDAREIALTTRDLRELLADNERLRNELNRLRPNEGAQ